MFLLKSSILFAFRESASILFVKNLRSVYVAMYQAFCTYFKLILLVLACCFVAFPIQPRAADYVMPNTMSYGDSNGMREVPRYPKGVELGEGAIGSDVRQSSDVEDDVVAQFKSLRADIEKLHHKQDVLESKLKQISADFEYRLEQLEKNQGIKRNKPSSDGSGDQVIATEPDIAVRNQKQISSTPGTTDSAAEYKAAFELMKNADQAPNREEADQKYRSARIAFEAFIKKYPKSLNVGDAYYWIGETYTREKDDENAAIQYLRGYRAGSTGGRAPDNLFKLSSALFQLGKIEEGCSFLKKLSSDFPGIGISMKEKSYRLADKHRCAKL